MFRPLALSVILAAVSHTFCDDNYPLSPGLEIFTNHDEVVQYFKNHSDPLAGHIIQAYEKDCPKYSTSATLESTRKPFIVIVGNNRAMRVSVGNKLAQMLTGRYMAYPAPCLDRFLPVLTKGTLLRRAFYFLCNYALAAYAKIQLALDKAVVLNGYYYEQMAFSIVNSFPPSHMPPVTSDLFKFPSDLLQPNLAFFVDLPDRLMFKREPTTRSPFHWKPRTVDFYQILKERHPMVVFEARRFPRDTAHMIYRYTKKHLYQVDGHWRYDPPLAANWTA